eukprot:7210187-Prymnesium_polylepis.1
MDARRVWATVRGPPHVRHSGARLTKAACGRVLGVRQPRAVHRGPQRHGQGDGVRRGGCGVQAGPRGRGYISILVRV